MSSKKSRKLDYYFGIFGRPYVKPQPWKVSLLGLNWFRIYRGERAFRHPSQLPPHPPHPNLFNNKKSHEIVKSEEELNLKVDQTH